MKRNIAVGAVLVSAAAVAAVALQARRAPVDGHLREARLTSRHASALPGPQPLADQRPGGSRERAELARRVAKLEARLAEESAVRQRLEQHLDELAARLASFRGPERDDGPVPASQPPAPATSGDPAASAAVDPSSAAPAANPVDYSKSPMERALLSAGLDDATAAEMKRRRDALTMQEMVLRDRATREQWIDSPRFAEEKAAIDAERMPIRQEIGDDAYDRYLFALGQTNRVRVDEVMAESPAAEAGLQAGDLILRYGEKRVFEPGELVAETRGGTLGESVPLEIVRGGERMEIEVPRGPLGLRIATAQDAPGAS